jgi:hypothetical protein
MTLEATSSHTKLKFQYETECPLPSHHSEQPIQCYLIIKFFIKISILDLFSILQNNASHCRELLPAPFLIAVTGSLLVL